LKFPSLHARASSRTCRGCARLFSQFSQESAECIRIGWRYQSACIGGRSAAHNRISDTCPRARLPQAAVFRTAHNAKPGAFLAFVADEGRMCLSWQACRTTFVAAPRRCPDNRVDGIYGLTQEPPRELTILSLGRVGYNRTGIKANPEVQSEFKPLRQSSKQGSSASPRR